MTDESDDDKRSSRYDTRVSIVSVIFEAFVHTQRIIIYSNYETDGRAAKTC